METPAPQKPQQLKPAPPAQPQQGDGNPPPQPQQQGQMTYHHLQVLFG